MLTACKREGLACFRRLSVFGVAVIPDVEFTHRGLVRAKLGGQEYVAGIFDPTFYRRVPKVPFLYHPDSHF